MEQLHDVQEGVNMRNLFCGPNLKLTSIKEADVEAIEKWFNDIAFLRYYDMLPAFPQNQKDVKQMLEEFSDSFVKYIFAIRENDSEDIIGIIGFDDIIWSNGVATVFIGIGDERYTGKGLGKEALSLLLDFGFNELNFYRIQLNVIAYNEGAIKLYENAGFQKEGTYRKFINRDGERYDMLLYGLLREEWNNL